MNSVYVLYRDKKGYYIIIYNKKVYLTTLIKKNIKYSIINVFEMNYVVFKGDE